MESKIGNLKLKNRILLAPMLEPNDIAFRLLCKKCNCGLTFTGMTSPLSKQKQFLQDKPALQLFANSKKEIKNFIKKYDRKVSLWDFNLGCPSKLSKQLGHGAYLQKDLKTILEIVKEMKASTKKPITIKLRKSKYALKIARTVEPFVDAIGIHARTIEQGYSGKPDYNFALKIKETVKVPVIYSGDVNEKNYKKILKDFDFVMIGRSSIGNPNIFSKMTNKKTKVTFKDYLRLAKKYKIFFRQIKFQGMNFTKGMKSAKTLRRKLIYAKTLKEIENIIQTK